MIRWNRMITPLGGVIFAACTVFCQESFPAIPLGEAGRAFLRAVNLNDRNALAETFRRFASEECLKSSPLDQQIAFWLTVGEQSGGLELVKADTVPGVLEVQVRTVRGSHYERIYMFRDKAEPGKFSEAGIVQIPDPAVERRLAFPESKLERTAVLAEIGRRVDDAAAADLFSGVVMVADDRQVLYEKSTGYAERSFDVPNNRETKFHLGSMNKMFTSIAIAQLVEAGRLRFTDTLAGILPEYPNRDAARKITIRNLLEHTSGLRMFFDNPAYDRQKKYATHLDLVAVFAGEPLLFEPGSRWSYSNEGFIVLGAVIEKLTGKSYYEYIREHIYAPAGMESSDSYRLDEVTPNLAIGYGRFEDDPLGIAPRRPNWMFLGWRGNACGGGYATAPDLVRFARALRGYKLLSKEMTETITTPKFSKRYGYGFITRTSAGKSIRGHGGGGPNSGVDTEMQIIWESGLTVIILSNYDAPFATDFCTKITDFLARQ